MFSFTGGICFSSPTLLYDVGEKEQNTNKVKIHLQQLLAPTFSKEILLKCAFCAFAAAKLVSWSYPNSGW
jgi:hypothetical protein